MIVKPITTVRQRSKLNISPDIIIIIDDERGRLRSIIDLFSRNTKYNKEYHFIYLKKSEINLNRSSFDTQFYNTITRANIIARIYPSQGNITSFLTEELPDWQSGLQTRASIEKFFEVLEKENRFHKFEQLVWAEYTEDFQSLLEELPDFKSNFLKLRKCNMIPSDLPSHSLQHFFDDLDGYERLKIQNILYDWVTTPDRKKSFTMIKEIFGVNLEDTYSQFVEFHIGIDENMLPLNRNSNEWFCPVYIGTAERERRYLCWKNNKRTLAALLFFLVITKMGFDEKLTDIDNSDSPKNNIKGILGIIFTQYFGDYDAEDSKLLYDFSRAKSDMKSVLLREIADLGITSWYMFRKDHNRKYLNIPPENIHIPTIIMNKLSDVIKKKKLQE